MIRDEKNRRQRRKKDRGAEVESLISVKERKPF